MTDHDELDTRLTRTLTEHADVMAGSSLGLAEVQGRARSIRRRRTAIAVAGVAAAVAVIVPTVSLATHSGGNPEPPITSQTPSPTQTATDAPRQPATGILDVSDLPTGDAPGMEFVEDGLLHEAGGGTVEVGTRYPVTGFVALSDGSRVWQTADDQGRPYAEVQDADGTFHQPVRSEWGLAVNAKHTVAAWVAPTGQVMVLGAGAPEPTGLGDPIPAGSELRVAAVSGDDCSLACSVDVNVSGGDGGWQPWEASLNGTQPLLDGGYLMVADISHAGLSIGYTKITDFGTCSKLLGGGEFQGWSTCKHTLASFSPDGSLVLADPAYHDGIGHGVIAMYDAVNGDLLFERRNSEKAQSFYPEAQWEDDTHVLAPVFQDGKWAIVRIASDGSMEYAVSPARGNDVDNPFILPTGGMPRS